MSNQALTWAFEQEGLPSKAKFVLVSIANHADHTNGYCWLKITTIARETAIPERSLFRYIGALIRNGYLRREKKRGADGKQRANDYWMLFDRPETVWDWGAVVAGGDDDAETQDAVEPDAMVASGEHGLAVGIDPTKRHELAVGPTAIGGAASVVEPPKTKPEKAAAPSFASPPRAYIPPPIAPPLPQGATHPDATKPIFVYVGTRAWDAWVEYKSRERGVAWNLKTTAIIDGEQRTGWYFPTLFPPSREPAKESAEGSKATGPPSKKTV